MKSQRNFSNSRVSRRARCAPHRSLFPAVLCVLLAGCRPPAPAPEAAPDPAPIREPESRWQPFRVTDFGAKGDGVTDDTDAIQRAITTVERTQTRPFYKRDTAHPELVFPAGTYLISRTLIVAATDTAQNLAMRGEGEATLVQKNPAEDIFYVHHGYRQTFENLGFSGGHTQIRFHSRNLNRAQLLVRDCRFADSGSYAVDDALFGPHWLQIRDPFTVEMVDGLPRGTRVDLSREHDVYFTSTILRIDRSEFIRCRNVARLFADWGMITRSRIVTHPDMVGAAIYSRGVLKISDTQVQAHVRPGRQQRFVDNINAGVMLDRVTLDTDGPGLTAVFNRRPYDNGGMYNTYVIIDNSRIRSAGSDWNSWVYCEEVPNLIRITDSVEISGETAPALGFRKEIAPEYFRRVSFPELVRRLPELERIFGYEVGMPRVFEIEDEKLPLNHSFSFHGNQGLSETMPAAMEPFRKGPISEAVREGFAPIARSLALELEAPRPARRLNVMDFGAIGDGVQDDTEAIRRALAAAAAESDTELVLPGKIYRVTETIELPPSVMLRGRGLAVFRAGTPDLTLFRGVNMRRAIFSGIGFAHARVAVDLTTPADAAAEILFDRCVFSVIGETAIRCFAGRGETREKNRTRVRVTDSIYGGAGRALATNAEDSLFDFNWISLHNGPGNKPHRGTLINHGALRVLDTVGVPEPYYAALWIENHGTLLVDNMRFGGEGELPKDLIMNAHPAGRIFMRYSWLKCDGGAVVLCKAAPEILALTDNFGIPFPGFQTMVVLAPGIGKDAQDVQEFLFERGNIGPMNIEVQSEL